MINRTVVVNAAAAGLVFGSIVYTFWQATRIENLEAHIRVYETAARVADDQISELTYQIYQLKTEKEFVGLKEFVAGATDALRRPEHYNAVWHDGYDRGVAVEADARASQQKETAEKAYTATEGTADE